MSKGKDWRICSECDREMQRCRAVDSRSDGTLDWVCRQCWRDLDYDRYLYAHRNPDQVGQLPEVGEE